MMNDSNLYRNKKLRCFLFLVLIKSSLCAIPYVGMITFPPTFTTSEYPGIYCNGYSIPVEIYTHPHTSASFSIEGEQGSAQKISILFVSKAVEPSCGASKSSIPSCLRVANNISYRYIELTQKELCTDNEKEQNDKCLMTWKIDETTLKNRQIPEKTIIILIDPSLVEMKNVEWDILDNFISLPEVNIKNVGDLDSRMIRLQFDKVKMNGLHERLKPAVDIKPRQTNLIIRQKCVNQCL